MHKCVNKSIGNIYHLEQLVGDFFPYSQEKLGFDKDVTVIFQSDDDNSSKILGKTAYYDPEAFEVVLYVDGRHPKDIMRSLSHELVHHAQNCRGDFRDPHSTDVGYAQKDPHLRKMEREAYTKGNLIFRDYEDLIKTGKKEVDIDFSKSGEPKMSLNEWRNNELNMLLMKKWGLLKEDKGWGKSPAAFTGTEKEEKEDIEDVKKGKGLEEEAGHPGQSCARAHPDEEHPVEETMYRDEDLPEVPVLPKVREGDEAPWDVSDKELGLHRSMSFADPDRARGEYEEDPGSFADPRTLGMDPMRKPKWGPKGSGGGEPTGAYEKDLAAHRAEKKKRFAGQFKEGKISIREAKEITRRIIARIKKESK